MRDRSGRVFSFRGFGLLLVLVGVFPAAALAQSSDPRPTLPETNIYEQRTYTPVNGVPVKAGWILFESEWPDQPHLGEIRYTPWGAPSMFWMCVDFPQLGKNSTICSYTDIFPSPPPPTVPEIPGTREWYCTWAINVMVYTKPFNIGHCGWQNPSKGIREGSFKYTDEAGANGLQQALDAIDFMKMGPDDPGDPDPQPEPDADQQALEAYLDKLIDKINETTQWRLMAEERGIDELTDEERLRLLNLLKADASCQAIDQHIESLKIDGLQNTEVFLKSSAEVEISLLRFGLSGATTLVLDIGQIVAKQAKNEANKNVEGAKKEYVAYDVVMLSQYTPDRTNIVPLTSTLLDGYSTYESGNEAIRAFKNMVQNSEQIGELKSAHQVRCAPVGNQPGSR